VIGDEDDPVTIEELEVVARVLRRWERDMASEDTVWTVVPRAQRGKTRQEGFLRLEYKRTVMSTLVAGLPVKEQRETGDDLTVKEIRR